MTEPANLPVTKKIAGPNFKLVRGTRANYAASGKLLGRATDGFQLTLAQNTVTTTEPRGGAVAAAIGDIQGWPAMIKGTLEIYDLEVIDLLRRNQIAGGSSLTVSALVAGTDLVQYATRYTLVAEAGATQDIAIYLGLFTETVELAYKAGEYHKVAFTMGCLVDVDNSERILAWNPTDDTAAPTISCTPAPVGGAATTIVMTGSEALYAASIALGRSVIVMAGTDIDNLAAVAGSIAVATTTNANDTITFTPSGNWTQGDEVVVVTAGIQDAAGNRSAVQNFVANAS